MDFERFKKINDTRLNYREMENATVVSSYRNSGCGDGYRLYLDIDEADEQKKIRDASYTTTGCGFGLVSLAIATEWLKDKTLAQAEVMTGADVEGLFEFPPRRKNYPESAAEAVQKAVADYKNGTGIHPEDRVSGAQTLEKLAADGHLRGAKLKQVILEGEDLQGIDFTGADLSHSFLQNSNLKGAILKDARLRGAFMNQCKLDGADLRGADLRWVKLTGASLEGAQFEGAVYDVGTRLDYNQVHLFRVMQKAEQGRDIYLTTKEPLKTEGS